jgi:hypothetical protein
VAVIDLPVKYSQLYTFLHWCQHMKCGWS